MGREREGMWEQKHKETEQSCFNHSNDLAQENFTPMRNVLIPFLGALSLIFHSSISRMLVVTQGLTPSIGICSPQPTPPDAELRFSGNDCHLIDAVCKMSQISPEEKKTMQCLASFSVFW